MRTDEGTEGIVGRAGLIMHILFAYMQIWKKKCKKIMIGNNACVYLFSKTLSVIIINMIFRIK